MQGSKNYIIGNLGREAVLPIKKYLTTSDKPIPVKSLTPYIDKVVYTDQNGAEYFSNGTELVSIIPTTIVDSTITSPLLVAYSESVVIPTISSGVLTIDLSLGNVFDIAHNANITTLSITNAPASGISSSFTLRLTQDATGGRTITFPASVKWSGSTPTLSTTANKLNKLVFETVNGGTTWEGALVGKDYA